MAVWGSFTAGAVLTDAELDAGTGGAWSTYTPTFGAFSLGNGTLVARYRHFGRVVVVDIAVTMGSTSSVSGAIEISRPVTAANAITGSTFAAIFDTGVGYIPAFAQGASTTVWLLRPIQTDGTYGTMPGTSASVPMTWTTGDVFSFTSVYEAAANGAA